MKKKITLSIGIPAYNEARNITHLLNEIFQQETTLFVLDTVFVCSDGSSDATLELVRAYKDKQVILLEQKERKGQAFSQNRIIKQTKSDILVLLNADISITDKKFIDKLVKPIISGQASLTCAKIEELPTRGFVQNLLNTSMKFKKYVFEAYKLGQSIYTCNGRARAFSKQLYKSLVFPHSIGEDAYSYLFCISKGYVYNFVKTARVYYKLPEGFLDWEKQGIRFYKSQKIVMELFGKDMISREYILPKKLFFFAFIKFLFIDPKIILYIIILIFLMIKKNFSTTVSDTWEIVASSKNIR